MLFLIVALTLLVPLMTADANAKTDAERLAEMFSPILILTEDTVSNYGEDTDRGILVLKPEPVDIMGATSAKNLRFWSVIANKKYEIDSYLNWVPPVENQLKLGASKVDFSQNKFAFFANGLYVGNPPSSAPFGQHIIRTYFDYPGTTPQEWNDEYTGSGARAGTNFSNTAYVHTYKRKVPAYTDSVTVLQYFYFYPYNDWWNNHEGDWQRIDVVVSSSDPNTATILGVEYRFHKVWVTYYKDWGSNPGLTDSFVFNPQNSLKLSPRPTRNGLVQYTHPVVYVGAGSHAGYPVGGNIDIFGPNNEYMTHTGLVLSTQAPASGSSLWERYELQLLPEPDLANTNNMGLTPAMSWLGAQIRWGTPSVDSPIGAEAGGGNESPERGPYNSHPESGSISRGWGNLALSDIGRIKGVAFYHRDLPYASYHHWAIIGDETWGDTEPTSVDTLSLSGDIVVFPGATLTINPGTIIEFTPGSDRYQFSKEGVNSSDDLIEIFVYGTLTTESPLPSMIATAADSILFQRNDPGGSGEAWGGIHVMAGGTATLNSYTRISDTRRGKPTNLTAKVKTGQVGHIELTWTNPKDRSIPQWEYQQKEGPGAWGPWMPISGSTWSTSEHTVKGLTPGVSYQFKVRGLNRTGLAASDPSAAVTAAGPPDPPELTVAAGHERVRVRWSPGADNGSKIEQHEWRYRAGEAAWNPDWTVYATGEQIVRNLDNDTTYTFQMKAKNKVGYSKVVAVQATPRHPIQGPTTLSVAENRDGSIASYRFAPAVLDQSLVDYRLKLSDIADSGLFALDRSGGLHFRDAPDFEAPTDGDGDGVYTVWIKAAPVSGDGPPVRREKPLLPFTKQVDVTVTDADDPGVIKLSSQSPQVGVPLTAALTDPDGGLTGVRWQWQAHAPDATEWQPLSSTSSAGAQSRFTPQAAQVGRALRAVVTGYGDRFGPGKSAQSEATLAVPAGVPDTPVLQAFGKNGEVRLNIKLVADNGSPITRTETRVYSVSQGDTTWRTTKGTWEPHSIDPDPLIYPNFFASGRTVSWDALTNGVTYTFEVRSVNGVGTSAIALTKATAGHTTWLSGGLLPLTYEVQSRVARSGHGWSVWSPVPGGGAARDTTIAGLLNGTEYEFMVRAVNEKGVPLAASNVVLATPADRPGVPVLTAAGGDGQVVLDWTAAAAHGSAIVRYEMRGRVADSGHGWPEWSAVPGGGSARDTTVAGLLNGTEYEFAVRAVNGVGAGVAALDTATPQGPPIFSSDSVSYSVPAGSTAQKTLPAAEGADSYETSGTLPGYVAVNTTTRAITIRPENTHVGDAEFIWRARNPHGTDDLTVNITVTSFVETEYAYRAGQTAPLFDASASGPPDHWSSGALTWTDAAPRVWRIGRTRPSGGHWSAWGQLKKYSERPAASATFYQRARSAPATPATQTGTTLATPSTWQTTPPTATDTEGVWTTTANRPQGEFQWIFTTPTQQTPPNIVQAPGLPRHFTADTGSPLTPGSIDLDWDSPTSGGTPTEYRVEYRFASGRWLSGATPTLTNASLVLSRTGARYQFRVRAENNAGNSSWVETTGTTSKQKPTKTETAYRLHTSGTTAPSFTASASTVPTGWSSSRQTPNPHARYEWQISRTRPADGSWSNWGSATVVSTYTERQTAFRLHTSGTSAPSFSATASGRPSGWSSSRPTPNPHARYEWQISRTRPADGSWSNWGSATVVSTYTERQTAFRLHTSGTTFSATASGSFPSFGRAQPHRQQGDLPAGRRLGRRPTSAFMPATSGRSAEPDQPHPTSRWIVVQLGQRHRRFYLYGASDGLPVAHVGHDRAFV